MKKNTFNLGDFTTALIMEDSIEGLFSIPDGPALLISDEHVWNILSSQYPELESTFSLHIRSTDDLKRLGSTETAAAVILPLGESAKTLANVELILQTAFTLGFGRDSTFIGLGGGAITDVSAFASSLFMRGNRSILIPTTLLSMVDAAFGGKTGINYFGLKNMVGSFYPASEVRVFPGFVQSLSDYEYKSGLAEVIKSAMLDDEDLYEILESNVEKILHRDEDLLETLIWKSLMVKGRTVLADLRESGIRAHLNLGHTFGHAIESAAGLGTWSHGQAVAWGIGRALDLGVLLGETDADYRDRSINLLDAFGYQLGPSGYAPEILLEAMSKDKKKKGGTVRFVLQKNLCHTFTRTVDSDSLLKVLS